MNKISSLSSFPLSGFARTLYPEWIFIVEKNLNLTGYYEFKNDVYFSQDYLDLKGYFNRIVDKFNAKLVIVKV